MVQTNKKNYKKLSGIGKLVWFGLALSFGMIINKLPYNVSAMIASIGSFLLLISIICSILATGKFYCEYKYNPETQNMPFSITGRLSRSKFFIYFFIYLIAFCLIMSIPRTSESDIYAILLLCLPFHILFLTAAIRRSQDCGMGSWFPLIPLVSIILFFLPSDNDNDFGPCPIKKTEHIQKHKMKKIENIKIEIVNNAKYTDLRKAERIKYLQSLKEQTSKELIKLNNEIEKEKDKMKDIPTDIAKYIKQKDTSITQKNILNLENKIIAIDEIIKSETTKQKAEKKQDKSWHSVVFGEVPSDA